VNNSEQDSEKRRIPQGAQKIIPQLNKIGASTPYDFDGKNLTAYGGLLPVATMLEKLGFQSLVETTLKVKRLPRVMSVYQFVLGMVLAVYVGFSRLNHVRFLLREPMLTGILQVGQLPPQCTFWRFLASLHLQVAQQLLQVQREMRQRVWDAAHVRLTEVTLDTDTTVHTVYGQQMGARKGYNPRHKGKKSFQPILTFIAETQEYLGGELRHGDRPSGEQIARHLASVIATAVIVGGFLNVSRARHGDALTRAFSAIGNLLILVLAVGIAWPVRYHLLHNWQAVGILIVTVIELLFAFRRA